MTGNDSDRRERPRRSAASSAAAAADSLVAKMEEHEPKRPKRDLPVPQMLSTRTSSRRKSELKEDETGDQAATCFEDASQAQA